MKKQSALIVLLILLLTVIVVFVACSDSQPIDDNPQTIICNGTSDDKLQTIIYNSVPSLDKVYDGIAVSAPNLTASSDAQVNFEWYKGDAKLESAPVHAGAYKLVVTVAESNGYPSKRVEKDFSISQKEIDLEWSFVQNLVYDQQAKTMTAVAKGLVGNDVCDVTVALCGDNVNVTDYGFYYTATALSNPNYKLPAIVNSERKIISKAVGTIDSISTNLTQTYNGNKVQAPSIPQHNGDGDVSVEWYHFDTKLDEAPVNAGENYKVVITVKATANYTEAKTEHHFAIRPKKLTVNWNEDTLVYKNSNFAINNEIIADNGVHELVTVDGIIDNDAHLRFWPVYGDAKNVTSNGFTVRIITESSNYVLQDDVTFLSGKSSDEHVFYITKRAVTVPAFNGKNEIAYDGTEKTISFVETEDNKYYETDGSSVFSATEVGEYTICAVIDSKNCYWTDLGSQSTESAKVLQWTIYDPFSRAKTIYCSSGLGYSTLHEVEANETCYYHVRGFSGSWKFNTVGESDNTTGVGIHSLFLYTLDKELVFSAIGYPNNTTSIDISTLMLSQATEKLGSQFYIVVTYSDSGKVVFSIS